MSEPHVGDAFFGVYCYYCKMPILLFTDQSRGQARIEFQGPGKLVVTCPANGCGRVYEYGTDRITRFTVAGEG